MTVIILKISLILVFINYCNTFEYRYVPNSEEYDKNLMLKSIVKNKNNKFVSRFDLNKLKHRRWDINFNDDNRQDINPNQPNTNYDKDKFNGNHQIENFLEIVPQEQQNDIIQLNETIQQIETTTLTTDLVNLTNDIISAATTALPQYESALSFDTKNISKFIYKKKPLETTLNYDDIQKSNNSDSVKKLPIYFTNPLTGIVYSITEVGYNYSEPSIQQLNDTNSIPIYIPKEQYDNDMNLLKMEFMQQCRLGKNQKNRTKFNDLRKTTIPNVVNKPSDKPVKSPVKNTVKKRKIKKLKIPKPTESDDDISDGFSGIGNVFDEVLSVIEDSGSSSEEHIKNERNLKLTNRNDKLNKKKIKIKPRLTNIFMKNGNQTLKIMNNKNVRTQVEKPINKTTIIPFIGKTTMQSFISSLPLQKSNLTNSVLKDSRIFSSRRKISKRSIKKSTLPSEFQGYKSIRKVKPFRSTQSNNYITEIPIVMYTTPSMHQFNNHRVFKRSLKDPTLKSQQFSTIISQTANTIPIELERNKRVKIKKLKNMKKTTQPIITTTMSTTLLENFTETPRIQQTMPTYYIHYIEKVNEKMNRNQSQNFLTTVTPLRTITTPLPPAENSPPSNKPKKSQTEYDDDYEDDGYVINYGDLPFADDFDDDKKEDDSNSKDDEDDEDDEDDDDDDYSSDEDSSESEEYLGHHISEINTTDPQRIHWTRKHIEKKRKRKRKPDDDEDNYDDDDDDEDVNGEGEGVDIMKFINLFFYPARIFFANIMTNVDDLTGNFNDRADDNETIDNDDYPILNNEKRKPKYPKYTVYKNKVSNVEAVDSSSSSWFSSWFSGADDADNSNDDHSINEIDIKPSEEPSSGWYDNWFGYDKRSSTTPPTSSEDYEDDDDDGYVPDWFSNWFESKIKKKKTTINAQSVTTPTTPMLTISNPMKNPQKWIGILAQHIINSTATPSSITSPQFEDDEPQPITYDKYQIWRLKPFGENQVKALEIYKNSADGSRLQWLQGPTLRGLTDVLVPPKLRTDFQGTLNFEDIAHEVLIFDIGKAIYYESKDNSITDTTRNAFAWKKYQTYDRIIRFIENLQVRNPNFIELFHIGRSYEGRPLVIVKIAQKQPAGKKKLKLKQKNHNRNNGVFIEAGLYGREWIAPASATWIINNIVKIMKSNQTTTDTEYIKKMTWFIMPVLNPDGYEYSHEYDRMWRKSRSKHFVKPNGLLNTAIKWFQQTKTEKICFGVDLDQNWNYEWGKDNTKSPCNEFFTGPNSFSEPETRAVSKFLMDHRKKIKLFISLQAYGQIISYPNKLNTSFSSQKMDDLLDVAMVGNDALRKSGSNSRYKIDTTNDLVAVRSGSSTSFAMYEAGIPFSYTIHLGDNGVHGYLLPSSNIESTSRDAFEIIKAMIDYI